MKINKKKVREIISSVIKNKNINASTYDSIDSINIIIEIEKKFKITIKTSQYINFVNLKKILEFLNKNNVV